MVMASTVTVRPFSASTEVMSFCAEIDRKPSSEASTAIRSTFVPGGR